MDNSQPRYMQIKTHDMSVGNTAVESYFASFDFGGQQFVYIRSPLDNTMHVRNCQINSPQQCYQIVIWCDLVLSMYYFAVNRR